MRRPLQRPQGQTAQFVWDFLTFEKMLTGGVVHLVYWAGLGIIGILAFGILGASVGVAIREGSILGVLLWRAFCEFYVTIFKISEDLHVLRQDIEAERTRLEK